MKNLTHVLKNGLLAVVMFSWVMCGNAFAEEASVDNLAGVYKYPVTVLFAGGEEETSENILEIVKLSDKTAYFRSEVRGANGHGCSIWGVADVADSELVFYQPGASAREACTFRLAVSNFRIELDDEGQHCRALTCGARAIYDGTVFERHTRRRIKYMQRLLNSKEYQQAVQDRADGKTGLSLKATAAPVSEP